MRNHTERAVDNTKGLVKSLQKAAQLMDALTDDRPDLSLSELARLCALHPSTARRLLATLEAAGLVQQDKRSHRYSLGMKLFELGHRVERRLELRAAARGVMRELVDRVEETAYLSTCQEGEVYYIDIVESAQTIKLTARIGQRLPLHSTGTGKVFLAAMSGEELGAILSRPLTRFTEFTICEAEKLRSELAEIRARGYAFTCEEHEIGASSVAAPIYDQHDRVIAALAISGPAYRLPRERLIELGPEVKEAALHISFNMGANPDLHRCPQSTASTRTGSQD